MRGFLRGGRAGRGRRVFGGGWEGPSPGTEIVEGGRKPARWQLYVLGSLDCQGKGKVPGDGD